VVVEEEGVRREGRKEVGEREDIVGEEAGESGGGGGG
jgi:hypothetical protein